MSAPAGAVGSGNCSEEVAAVPWGAQVLSDPGAAWAVSDSVSLAEKSRWVSVQSWDAETVKE